MKRLTRLYLLRHGQVKGFESFPIYGHTDVELTETGVMQMEHAARRLELCPISAVYCSDLKRASRGAELIACRHDAPVRVEKDLREMYFGAWEGLTLSHIREHYPEDLLKRQEDLINYEAPGGGESLKAFSLRIKRRIEVILQENEGEEIAMVAHGGTNRVILALAMGLGMKEIFKLHQDYGCLNIIDYYPESALVRLVNG
jgi:alpha-ribazole phosphatase/probable phosphoglycerate mutase